MNVEIENRESAIEDRPTGPTYWRSLDELADTPAFREFVEREFPGYQPQMVLSSTRRNFLKIMGASVALAGLTGCRRWPVRKLAPYADRPEGQTPGAPEKYATAFELDGVAQPVVVTTIDGRPIKIEGNDRHPESRGAATLLAQASILNLYDPHRSRGVMKRNADGSRDRSTWPLADAALGELIAKADADGGAGLTFLCEPTRSPTFDRLKAKLQQRWAGASWATHQPLSDHHVIEGVQQAIGTAARPRVTLSEADVIVALDSDFLMSGPEALRLARQWADRRRKVDTEHTLNRLYVAEPTFTVTGTNADERLAIRSSRVGVLASLIAAELGVGGGVGGADPKLAAHAKQAAKDLRAAGGRGVVIAGPSQPASVHAMVAAINAKLGAPVTYIPAADEKPASVLPTGTRTLVILGGNPVYDGPGAIAEQIEAVPTSFHLAPYDNETSRVCTWHLPQAHYLEAWGDACATDGTVSIVQPTIHPLFNARSALEILARLAGESPDGLKQVKATFGGPTKAWREALHNGYIADSGSPLADAGNVRPIAVSPAAPAQGYEIVFRRDYKLHDGSFADNGWLQELPDPTTKLTWDNAASMSLVDADKLGVDRGDIVAIRIVDTTVELPAMPLPGHPEGTITLSVGYGRPHAGPVGQGIGVDVYPLLRASGGKPIAQGAKVSRTGARHELVVTQDHFAIAGDGSRQTKVEQHLIRSADLKQYKHDADFATGHHHEHIIPLPRYGMPEKVNADAKHAKHDDHDHDAPPPGGPHPPGFSPTRQAQPHGNPLTEAAAETDHQWGMVIDLNTCIGCNNCVVACQAENNIPIVGKSQVKMNREMHWLRIDRYYTGDPMQPDDIRALHQPMMCVHCENAPCEPVCPVAATVHDSEGLNVMVYNRCIGTRYCSNNCPYKVRRFNYFDWNARDPRNDGNTPPFLGIPDQQQLEKVDQVRRMGFNPEVTVRMRGVMEKCTYCTQRIQNAKQHAYAEFGQGKRDQPVVADGEIQTACQQTCPTQAITFGNLKDKTSAVHKLTYENPRSYTTLSHLNVRPRTNYLARITNPVKQETKEEHAPPDEH